MEKNRWLIALSAIAIHLSIGEHMHTVCIKIQSQNKWDGAQQMLRLLLPS